LRGDTGSAHSAEQNHAENARAGKHDSSPREIKQIDSMVSEEF